MANIQHLYRGVGNPNDNPALELTGDAVGNHVYQDINNSQSVWISTTYEDQGNFYHEKWERLILELDLGVTIIAAANATAPLFEGEMGISQDDGDLFIAMRDPSSGYTLRWRSTGIAMGAWYTP